MENKNWLNKGLRESLFGACRLVFMADAPEVASGSPGQKGLETMTAILKKIDPALNTNFLDPGTHPLGGHLVTLCEKHASLDLTNLDALERKDGVLTFKTENTSGEVTDTRIDGLEYAVLFWPEVRTDILKILGSTFPANEAKLDTILSAALSDSKSGPLVSALIADLVAGKKIDPEKLKSYLAPFKVVIAPGAAKARVGMKAELKKGAEKKNTTEELAALKKDFPHFPTKPSLKMPEFNKQVEAGGIKDKLFIDTLALNISRESNQDIGATRWKLTSQPEIKQVHADFDRIGLLDHPNTAFFNQCFFILNEAYSPKNTHFTDSTTQTYFNNPIKFRKEIMILSPNAGFDPDVFFAAYDEIIFAKKLVLSQDSQQVASLTNQEGMGRDTIANKAHDFLKSNFDSFRNAIRSKDYATAGVYAVGIWAIYKSLKLSGLFKKGGDGMKYMAYGLAAYCGVKFAENAGYDLLKMAGFRDPDFEVQGTPMEAFYNTLRGGDKTERQLAKDVDWQIVSRVGEMSLVDLQEFREDANDANGVQFISPHLMPDLFPGLADEYLSIESLGLGKNAMSDYTGMSDIKLTPAQKEYKRVGLQLFKIATMMEVVYNNTLKIDDHPNNPYKDWEYEDAIGKGNRDLGKVRHLASAVSTYAPSKAARKLKSDEVKRYLMDEVFGPYENAGVTIVEQPNKFGHYTGTVKGFPVMFVPDGERGYRVYLMNNYNGSSNAGRKYITGAIIPYEGPAGNAPDIIIKAVETRMDKLLAPLKDASGKKLDSLKYINGEWVCDVTIKGIKAFGLPPTLSKQAKIMPDKYGKRLSVVLTDGSGVRINLDETVDKQYPIGTALVPHFISDKKFQSLAAFSNVQKLSIEDIDPSSRNFTVKFGRNDFKLQVHFNGTDFDFVDPADERKLLEDPQFGLDYVDAILSDDDFYLNKTTDKLKKLVGTSPDNILVQAWDKITGQGFGSQEGFNLDFTSGSIPDYLTHGVIDGTKYQVTSKLRNYIKDAPSLEKLNLYKDTLLHDAEVNLESVYKTLVKERHNMKDWDRLDFMLNIVYPIRSAGSKSMVYDSARTDTEQQVYSEIAGPMLSDFDKDTHNKASSLMNVFMFYTAHLDNQEYKAKGYISPAPKPPLSPTISDVMYKTPLDTLKNPPTAKYPGLITSGDNKSWEDPGLRGHYVLNYLEYVKGEVVAHSNDSDVVPSPPAWKNILDFDTWAEQKGTYIPLDVLDKVPAYTHGLTEPYPFKKSTSHPKPAPYTDLEKAITAEFDKGISHLIKIFGHGNLNVRALKLHFRRKATKIADMNVGKFKWVKVPNKKKTLELHCELRKWANDIDSIAPGSRSKQMALIQDLVRDRLIKEVMDPAKRDKFFLKSATMSSWFTSKWPKLKTMPVTSWIF